MKESIHTKYLLANEQDASWGLIINSVGFQHIEAGTPYPPKNHPARYLFSPITGRRLNEYQLVYISRGKGHFASKNFSETEIKSGYFFLLFPGEWHNYQPDRNTGWDDYWIGFSGVNMDVKVKNGFFTTDKPIFNVGVNEEIVQFYKHAISVAQQQEPGFQQVLAGIVNYLLGFAYSRDKLNSLELLQAVEQINQAKVIMLDSYTQNIPMEKIAQQVNMSYSTFRRLFKQYVGFSPLQYLQELRLSKSKDLLTNTTKSIKEIAFETGFDNADYFGTAFHKRTKMTPRDYRNFTQGKNLSF